MADSYSALWESKALSTSDLTTVHKITDAYLLYYQQKGRSFHISGKHFVAFCKHFRQASEWGVHNYSRAVMERFGWILKEDQLQLTVSQLLEFYKCFDFLATHWNRDLLLDWIMHHTHHCIKSNDTDLVALFRMYHTKDLLYSQP